MILDEKDHLAFNDHLDTKIHKDTRHSWKTGLVCSITLRVVLVFLAKYECSNFLCIIVILDFHCTDLTEYVIVS